MVGVGINNKDLHDANKNIFIDLLSNLKYNISGYYYDSLISMYPKLGSYTLIKKNEDKTVEELLATLNHNFGHSEVNDILNNNSQFTKYYEELCFNKDRHSREIINKDEDESLVEKIHYQITIKINNINSEIYLISMINLIWKN